MENFLQNRINNRSCVRHFGTTSYKIKKSNERDKKLRTKFSREQDRVKHLV